jgi:(S)-2-hydroxyglutarate dehydrogenase
MRTQVVVVGAGVVGAATALALAQRGVEVLVLEKEPEAALHQSGRNSGVLHAGYNQRPGTRKASACVEGNREAKAWCRKQGVAVQELGAFVVARTEGEVATLRELERRAAANGAKARIVGRDTLREAEPHAEGLAALHAPEVASVDARGFVQSLVAAARESGAKFLFGQRGRIQDSGTKVEVTTPKGRHEARVVVNAAGLQADRVAAAQDLRVIPFRGTYCRLRRPELVRTHLYAAPDLAFPFLGVHLSRRADGEVLVGPGAMLALGRQAYQAWRAHPRDVASTLSWPGFWRMLGRTEVRGLVRSEVAKSLRRVAVAKEAQRLVPALRTEDLVRAPAGIRAQLVARDGSFVDDILVREEGRAIHVLNAVSPGLTCSLPFGRDLAQRAQAMLQES